MFSKAVNNSARNIKRKIEVISKKCEELKHLGVAVPCTIDIHHNRITHLLCRSIMQDPDHSGYFLSTVLLIHP